MKKSDNETCRPNKNKTRRLYSLLFIPVIGFCCWGAEIGNDTLNQTISNLWYIPFAIIGLAVGVIRLIRDKDIVWNKKEYLGGVFYALIHSAIAMLIATVIFYVIFILNFYIPTNHPNYEETAMVINKSYTYNIRSYGHHHITFQFENKEINDKVIRIDKALFNQIKLGDTCTITLQNGFFNIPIIKDKSFD